MSHVCRKFGPLGPKDPKWLKRVKIMLLSYLGLHEVFVYSVYTLLLGLGGCLINWNGLVASIVTFWPHMGIIWPKKTLNNFGDPNFFVQKFFCPDSTKDIAGTSAVGAVAAAGASGRVIIRRCLGA